MKTQAEIWTSSLAGYIGQHMCLKVALSTRISCDGIFDVRIGILQHKLSWRRVNNTDLGLCLS